MFSTPQARRRRRFFGGRFFGGGAAPHVTFVACLNQLGFPLHRKIHSFRYSLVPPVQVFQSLLDFKSFNVGRAINEGPLHRPHAAAAFDNAQRRRARGTHHCVGGRNNPRLLSEAPAGISRFSPSPALV